MSISVSEVLDTQKKLCFVEDSCFCFFFFGNGVHRPGGSANRHPTASPRSLFTSHPSWSFASLFIFLPARFVAATRRRLSDGNRTSTSTNSSCRLPHFLIVLKYILSTACQKGGKKKTKNTCQINVRQQYLLRIVETFCCRDFHINISQFFPLHVTNRTVEHSDDDQGAGGEGDCDEGVAQGFRQTGARRRR